MCFLSQEDHVLVNFACKVVNRLRISVVWAEMSTGSRAGRQLCRSLRAGSSNIPSLVLRHSSCDGEDDDDDDIGGKSPAPAASFHQVFSVGLPPVCTGHSCTCTHCETRSWRAAACTGECSSGPRHSSRHPPTDTPPAELYGRLED